MYIFFVYRRYMDEWKAEQQAKSEAKAVFPCVLRILPEYVFNKKNPIVLGVEVSEGILKVLNVFDDHIVQPCPQCLFLSWLFRGSRVIIP